MTLRTAALVIAALAIPSTALATPSANGKVFNTEALNGKVFNGKVFNSQMMEAVSTSGAWKDNASLYGVGVQGNGLVGWVVDWTSDSPTWEWKYGADFVGTNFLGTFVNTIDGTSEVLRLHIDGVVQPEAGNDTLLHWITVHSTDGGNANWNIPMPETSAPLCTDADGNAVPAILLRGEWSQAEGVAWGGDQISDSPYEVTFACVTGALGKCAADLSDTSKATYNVPNALGYPRWREPRLWAVDLPGGGWTYLWRDYVNEHQACTRMIRADYCGNGTSWTTTGTQIDVYDRMHDNWYEPTSVVPDWFFDATWNEDGAVAVSACRINGGPITCDSLSPIGVPAMSALGSDFARVIPLPTVRHDVQCLVDDGLSDPRVRLGNLRHALPGE